jgi:hypothetical protein
MLISERHDVLLGGDGDAAVGAIAVNSEAKDAAPWAGRDGEFETAFLDAAVKPVEYSLRRAAANAIVDMCRQHYATELVIQAIDVLIVD